MSVYGNNLCTDLIITGSDNHTGILNEYLQRTFGFDVGTACFSESYECNGAHHQPVITCELTFHGCPKHGLPGHSEISKRCLNKKQAKKDACRLMLPWFQAIASDFPAPLSHTERQTAEAFIGDKALDLMLALRCFAGKNNAEVQELHSFCSNHSNNDFLSRKYVEMHDGGRGVLPDGLSAPSGNVNADARQFEAWVGRKFMENDCDPESTAYVVLPPLLGVAAAA